MALNVFLFVGIYARYSIFAAISFTIFAAATAVRLWRYVPPVTSWSWSASSVSISDRMSSLSALSTMVPTTSSASKPSVTKTGTLQDCLWFGYDYMEVPFNWESSGIEAYNRANYTFEPRL